MKTPAICVVGSANTDMIVRVPRLPGRGETVLGGDLVTAGGGKGANQAIAARRLGSEVVFVARLGRDALGDSALAAFAAEGLRTDFVARDAAAPSGVALILVEAGGENVIAVAPGANARLSPEQVRQAEPAIAACDVVITQLEVPLDAVRAALEAGRRAGVRTILNPAPAPAAPLPDALYPLVDVLNPNRSEVAALTGLRADDVASAERAGRRLLERGVGGVVVTLGREGALVVAPDAVRPVPAYPVASVDATGAGDAFTAGLAVALAGGATLPEAAEYASAVAALATTRVGAQPSLPTAAEVQAFLAGRRG